MRKTIFLLIPVLFFIAISTIAQDKTKKKPSDYKSQFSAVTIEKNARELPINSSGLHSQYIPPNLRKHIDIQSIRDGFIDVSKPPYSVIGDGKTDNTVQIQMALNDAYLCRMIVYFPPGIYLVSNRLKCYRGWNDMWNYPKDYEEHAGMCFSRLSGYQIIGSSSEDKSIIKLKDNSKVEGNILLEFLQYDMDLSMRDRSNYCALLRNIMIDMGNNPEVSAVKMPGAQYSTIEDVTIYGENFNIGIKEVPGSGGSMTNIKVIGGMIGIEQAHYRPNPLGTGVELIGQEKCGVRLKYCRGPLVLCGFKIVSKDNPDTNYKAIFLDVSSNKTGNGNLAIQDGSIEVKGKQGIAIGGIGRDVIIKNVFIKSDIITTINSEEKLKGNKDEWLKITYLAYSRNNSPVIVNGEDVSSKKLYLEPIINEYPHAELLVKHSWYEMPSWDESNHVNVVTDYGATPTFGITNEYLSKGDADDIAIQMALDETTTPGHPNFGKTVFIPHGDYRITKPLVLKTGSKLIGAGKTSSVLQQAFDVWEDPSKPVIETVDEDSTNIVLSDFYICAYPRGRFFHIRSGNIIMRDVQTHVFERLGYFKDAMFPYASFSGHASGKIYNMCSDHIMGYDSVSVRNGTVLGKSYHLLLIENKTGYDPLNIYQASIEHLDSYKGQAKIISSKNIHFYALKAETIEDGHTLMHIEKSSDISVFGTSGLYYLSSEDEPAIYNIKSSYNIELFALTRHNKWVEREITNGLWVIENSFSLDDDSHEVRIFRKE